MWQLKSLRAEVAHGGATREVARRPGPPTTLSVGAGGLVSRQAGPGPHRSRIRLTSPPPVRWSSGTQPQATATKASPPAPRQPVHSARFFRPAKQPTNGRARMEGPRPRHRPGKKREPRRPVRSRSIAPARQHGRLRLPLSSRPSARPRPAPRRARVRFHVPPRGGRAICPAPYVFRGGFGRFGFSVLDPTCVRFHVSPRPCGFFWLDPEVVRRSRRARVVALAPLLDWIGTPAGRRQSTARPPGPPPHACVWFCVRGPARFGGFHDVRKRGRRQQL